MNEIHKIELFILKCAVIESGLQSVLSKDGDIPVSLESVAGERLDVYIKQFDIKIRNNAKMMSRYYELFYMLENDIRILIAETLESAHGARWWENCVPAGVKEEARKNKVREEQAAVSLRSEQDIDYTTFGQLGEIIRENWVDFAGMLSNQSAVTRVLAGLNMLRGTIAHCGVLAEDEVDRLKLAILDWFRVLQGPKS